MTANRVEDFTDYAEGMSRLERWLPRNRSLLILAAWAVAAWYWHAALVLLAFAALGMAKYVGHKTTGLIVEGEATRRELSELNQKIEELERRIEGEGT